MIWIPIKCLCLEIDIRKLDHFALENSSQLTVADSEWLVSTLQLLRRPQISYQRINQILKTKKNLRIGRHHWVITPACGKIADLHQRPPENRWGPECRSLAAIQNSSVGRSHCTMACVCITMYDWNCEIE